MNLTRALDRIRDRGYQVLRKSSVYESEPWGGAMGGVFTNAVFEIARAGEPRDVLRGILSIESDLGRVRSKRYAPRPCDLDILFWADAIIEEADLRIPHPLIGERRFVLVPLAELAPDMQHPLTNRTMADMLASCKDPLRVWPRTPRSEPNL